MNIVWHGQSFFGINTKGTEGFSVKIAIDPFGEGLGLRVPKVEADILLITHQHEDHSNVKAIKCTRQQPSQEGSVASKGMSGASKGIGEAGPFLIDGPGEYERKGIFIKGILAFHDKSEGKERGEVTVYKIEAEDMKLCHLSDFGQKELSPEQLEKIGEIDILILPVGSEHSLGAKEASSIIAQIEPRIVIPMHYKIPKLKVKLEAVDKFLKLMGAEDVKPEKKLKISLKDLPKEETKIVLLSP